MDVFKFVLWAITKLTLAATGAVVAIVVFLLEKLTGHVRSKARQAVPQQEPRPTPQAAHPTPPPASVGAPPTVHVHVHIDQGQTQPVIQAAPQSSSSPPSTVPPPAWILNHPDHRIYVTTGSHLMQEHPACDDLLERLDEMLYIAAHRNGDPFTVAPPLDTSRKGHAAPLDLPPLAPVDDGEFIGEERQALPPPDGALWFRKAGETPQRLATGTPS
jgi:hypothetical protein